MLDRTHFEGLDAADPLAGLRGRFELPAGVIYLDGNSLGPLAGHVPGVVEQVVGEEWGRDLIRSWNLNGWWTLAERVGERIAPLIGAPPGSVIAGDTTTVALYKAAGGARRMRPGRRVILTDDGNFPTDLYALESLARAVDAEVSVVAPEAVESSIDDTVAVVCLTHVDYRTGRRHDMAAITAAAHSAGALMVWDLSHSVGAMDLDVSAADMAVGCGYKYLNGGPGAPAFVYVHPDHQASFENPIAGWWGHRDPFAMDTRFAPAGGIRRLAVGTQPILSLAALHAALEVFEGLDMRQVREKSERMVAGFILLVEARLPGFEVVTPPDVSGRGSHVSLAHPEARQIMAALIDRGVIGDLRPPNLLRFGLAPSYLRYVDIWDAVEILADIIQTEAWREAGGPAGPVT
jgi:kynureninase